MDLFVLVGVPFMFISYFPLRNLLVMDTRHVLGLKAKQVVPNQRFYQKHAPVDGGDVYFKGLRQSLGYK